MYFTKVGWKDQKITKKKLKDVVERVVEIIKNLINVWCFNYEQRAKVYSTFYQS